MTRRPRAWFYVVLALLPLLLSLLLIEMGGRVFLALWPAHDVLFLEPDRAVGWKQVANLQWTWSGTDWFARDYSIPVHTNALGFRDREHEPAKPAGVVRIALLGDSLVEALQVPLEQTAGALLEAQLNAEENQPARYEVLNCDGSVRIGCRSGWRGRNAHPAGCPTVRQDRMRRVACCDVEIPDEAHPRLALRTGHVAEGVLGERSRRHRTETADDPRRVGEHDERRRAMTAAAGPPEDDRRRRPA
jgi:hypothetical protein